MKLTFFLILWFFALYILPPISLYAYSTNPAYKNAADEKYNKIKDITLPAKTPLTEEKYKVIIQKRIAYFSFYPHQAKEQKLKGKAEVTFIINKDGLIENLRIIKSSGFSLLDKAALWIIQLSAPLPPPGETGKEKMEITIPVQFPQQDGKTVEKLSSAKNYKKMPLSLEKWAKSLQEEVTTNIIYPQEAKEKKWEGIAKIKFLVKKDGSIEEVKIDESSNCPLLDKAALQAVKNAGPYPFPTLPKEQVVIIPVRFAPPRKISRFDLDSFAANRRGQTTDKAKGGYLTKTTGKTASLDYFRDLPPGFKESPGAKEISFGSEKETQKNLSREDGKLLLAFEENQELKNFIETALKNNRPLGIIKEEIALAKIKLDEAKRNFFPTLKLEAYHTWGEDHKIEYEEDEKKISIGQTIYSSGRFDNAFKQAYVNMEMVERNYDEQKIDVIHKAETAYYNVVALQMNIAKQEKIVKEGDKTLAVIKRQYDSKTIVSVEYNKSKSLHRQLEFQLDSTKQELEMAKLSLRQALDTETIPDVKNISLKGEELDLDLEKCVRQSLKHRPEILLGKLSVRFNEYSKKIEEAKNGFNVELNTSYGWYEGAYTTESMRSADNWYAGVKVTKPFGASTASASYTLQKAEPKIGQTAPNKTSTISGELSILDNIKQLADKKNADISLLKAKNQLNETEKSIVFEVQDAFLDHKKALLQLKTALTQKEFREQEIRVITTKASVGEESFTGVIESLYNLSQAENTYLQALGNYHISLATLKKTMGYGTKL